MLITTLSDISGKRSILTLMWCIEILWTRDQPLDYTEFRVLTLLHGHTMCCHQEKSQKKIIWEQRQNLWQEEGAAISLDLHQQYLESPDLSCLCPWGSLWPLLTGDQASTRAVTPWWTGFMVTICQFCPSPRFGSIYEMEEKDDEKEAKENAEPVDENDEEGRSPEEPSPDSDHQVTCYLEDEVASAKSMCNLDMPSAPAAARWNNKFWMTLGPLFSFPGGQASHFVTPLWLWDWPKEETAPQVKTGKHCFPTKGSLQNWFSEKLVHLAQPAV